MTAAIRLLLVAIAITLCSTGQNLYVSSFSTGNVSYFDASNGAPVGSFTTPDPEPEGLAVGPDGNLYVASFSGNDVFKYSLFGTPLGTFISAGSGGLNGPRGIAFGPDGNLYVTSSFSDNSVIRYNGTTGASMGVFVTNGLGGLASPHGLVFDGAGNLYVASSGNSKIIEYNSAGGFVRVFASGGALNFPFDLKFMTGGDLLVSSFGGFQVLRYNGATGASMGVFGQADHANGGLVNPTGLAFGPDGNLYVANGSVTIGSAVGVVRRFNGATGAFIDQFVTGLSDPIYIVFAGSHVPPTINKVFNPPSIGVGGISTLTFTIVNPSAPAADTNIGFTDPVPSGLVIATPNGLTGSCGGGLITATAGSSSISLSGATLAAGASCSFSVNVVGTTAGPMNNQSGAIMSDQGAGNKASATLSVLNGVAPPTLSKSFGASQLSFPGPDTDTNLTFTVTNPAANTITLYGITFSDVLPAGLTVATPNGLTGSCGGGVITAPDGSPAVSLSGATLAPGISCTFSVNVTATTPGNVVNTTSAVTSTTLGAPGSPAVATISVVDLFFSWFFSA